MSKPLATYPKRVPRFHHNGFPTALGFKLMGMKAELKGGGHLVEVWWDGKCYRVRHDSPQAGGNASSGFYSTLAAARKEWNRLKKEIIGF